MEKIIMTICNQADFHPRRELVDIGGKPSYVHSLKYTHRDGEIEFPTPTVQLMYEFLRHFASRPQIVEKRFTICDSCIEIMCDSAAIITDCGGKAPEDPIFNQGD